MDVGTSEDGAFWLAFLRSLNARGLSGVELVISDAHQGLKQAIATVFAGAGWQRCRTHFMANLLTRVPKRSQPGVAAMVRTIYQQLSPEEVRTQADRVVVQLQEHFPQAAQILEDDLPDILVFTAFPASHLQKLRSNNPLERLNKEIRRRTDVFGIFPNLAATRRLVGAVLAEQHGEWAETRHDSEMRRFYDRLRERGKPGNVSVVAVMRKILLQLNAVAHRGTPWVPQAG